MSFAQMHGDYLDPDRQEVEEVETQETLLRNVPEEFRAVLSGMAYEQGHSAGEAEVLGILRGLVADLLPAIKEFEKRIGRTSNA